MEKKTLGKGLLILGAAVMKGTPEFTKESTNIWYEMLKDVDDGAFLRACEKLIKTEEWFPCIATIRKIAKPPLTEVEQVILADLKREKQKRLEE